MIVGDLVRNKYLNPVDLGVFMGMVTFKANTAASVPSYDYTCAKVMWVNRSAPNGDRVSTIDYNLIERVELDNGI